MHGTPLTLRPESAEDLPFLRQLYASTREAELAQVPWSPEQKAGFLGMQFEAQTKHYRAHYRQASFDLLMLGDTPVGRLYVDRQAEEIRIVDIALLPDYRNRGFGRAVLEQLIEEARALGRPLTIHVEGFNPARRLYERLGFREVKADGVYNFMEWRAD